MGQAQGEALLLTESHLALLQATEMGATVFATHKRFVPNKC